MNKRLKFCTTIVLIFAIIVSVFAMPVPVASYETDVKTSTADMLMINIDTNTVVFSQKPDNKWYMGSLSELMTFIIAYEEIQNPENKVVTIRQSFIDSLPYSDGCLERFVGRKLSAKDLMAIMLLTSGSDAAYALADIASNHDIDAFVALMNERAAVLKLKDTIYLSPGYSADSRHHTTCRDLYTVYMEARKNKFFTKTLAAKTYTPAGYEDEEDTVKTDISILNGDSPYYFRYAQDAQYSYSTETYANLAVTTTYRGMTYFFAGLLGKNESEKNVYSDAKKMTTWAYLNLSDRKMINAEDSMASTMVTTDWGEYQVDLHPFNSSFKTLPIEYDEALLSYTYDIPRTVKAPLRTGQTIGKAKMYYGNEQIDEIALMVQTDEGLGILHDIGRFTGYVLTRLTPRTERKIAPVPTEPPVSETAAPTAAPSATSATEAAAPTAAPVTER